MAQSCARRRLKGERLVIENVFFSSKQGRLAMFRERLTMHVLNVTTCSAPRHARHVRSTEAECGGVRQKSGESGSEAMTPADMVCAHRMVNGQLASARLSIVPARLHKPIWDQPCYQTLSHPPEVAFRLASTRCFASRPSITVVDAHDHLPYSSTYSGSRLRQQPAASAASAGLPVLPCAHMLPAC